MPSRKVKPTKSLTAPTTTDNMQPQVSFPFGRYTSVAGVHTSLLTFSALFLPSTPLPNFLQHHPSDPVSRDPLHLLTANPARTVAWMCGGAVILQAWWASWLRTWTLETRNLNKGAKDGSAEQTRQKLERRDWNSGRLAAFGDAALLTLGASVIFHVMVILFGAPISSHPLHTYFLSLLLALLTVFPSAYTLGPPSQGSDTASLVARMTWVRLFAELSPRTPIERAVVYPAVGAVLGCWVGPFQLGSTGNVLGRCAWPLTPAYGAITGFILGSLIALVTSASTEFAQAEMVAQAEKLKRV
ncbi:hypothetical protein A0H81_03356 [Grifola frondosa]|uniref:Uncharacterized protein n=1 Tax=Grifola frondosa TaxID=5627 RepID=A0A1C7MH05_GRIFR|nr:hypothetical protein A0H81_03356 [Grifola frondosa]